MENEAPEVPKVPKVPEVPKDVFSFLQYIHNEKLTHKEHRHKHVIQKLLISGAILSIGQLVENPNLAFFVILLLPLICLVHDIYIFAEHFKVRRIGCFLLNELKEEELPEDSLIKRWEKYVSQKREVFAVWGSLVYTVLLAIVAAVSPWILGISWTPAHSIIYGISMGITGLAILLVFLVAYLLNKGLSPTRSVVSNESGHRVKA